MKICNFRDDLKLKHWCGFAGVSIPDEHSQDANIEHACAICSAKPILVAVSNTECPHRFCYTCAQRRWQETLQPTCPLCNRNMKQVQLVADIAIG